MAHQQAVQRGATHRGIDELTHYRQQAVQRHAQSLTQVDDQFLMAGVERRLQAMRGVAAVFHRVTVLPALHGRAADAVPRGQLGLVGRGLLDLRAQRRRGRCVLVERDDHVAWLPGLNATMTVFRTSRPKGSARLFCSSQSSGT